MCLLGVETGSEGHWVLALGKGDQHGVPEGACVLDDLTQAQTQQLVLTFLPAFLHRLPPSLLGAEQRLPGALLLPPIPKETKPENFPCSGPRGGCCPGAAPRVEVKWRLRSQLA